MSVIYRFLLAFLFAFSLNASAELPWQHDDHTRYLAMGDSVTAGWGADPTTNGYAYRLYQQGVYDQPPFTLFANAAVPGSNSEALALYQAHLAGNFLPHFITLTVGGNDLDELMAVILADPDLTLPEIFALKEAKRAAFNSNLHDALELLCELPIQPEIYVGNLYGLPELEEQILLLALFISDFNDEIVAVVGDNDLADCPVVVVDLHAAFDGRSGLLQGDRQGAKPIEIHPTNAGHKVIAKAFIDAMLP